ncbi:MAG: hypothetical protein JWN14_5128 [Chthonomonadales bacterium]|nr:hypothetical protein [Chthonomonadales bacterium]
MSKSKTPLLLLIVLVLIGLGYGGYTMSQSMGIASRADTEAKAEESERKECQTHLTLFFNAWKQYKADHKGAEPQDLPSLFPKYLSDPSVLMCPTAVRLDKEKQRLDRGSFELNRKSVDVTYGFRWMTAGYSKQVQKLGDTIPLVVCKCHQQAMYQLAYNKPPHESVFDDESRGKLNSTVANAPILGVRRDGKVGVLDSSNER